MNINIQKNIPLAPLTTFKIGGPAEFFLEAKTKDELREAAAWAKENNQPLSIIGGGSNLLVNDAGVKGLVIKLTGGDLKFEGRQIMAGAGASLAGALKISAEQGLSGLEWSAGIPRATIGGAVRGNAGAFGTAMEKIVREVEIYDLKKNKFTVFTKSKCRFKYRNSIFKKNPDYLIIAATLELKKDAPEKIRARIAKNLSFRKNTPRDPSAGSIFKNVSMEEIKKADPKLAEKLAGMGTARIGNIGAGLIIDRLLDLKGKAIGGAKISEEHGNFIVNAGGAAAGDIAALISYIKQQCRDRLGLELHEEIIYLGF